MDISVVIPTRDRATLLDHAVSSVRASLADLPAGIEAEIIIVDNSSTMHGTRASERVATAHGARFIVSERAGASTARNTGIRAARGSFVSFLDDDDAYLPEHLPILSQMLRTTTAGIAFGQLLMCNEDLTQVYPRSYPDPPFPAGEAFRFALATILSPNVMMIRKDVLEELGGFDERYSMCEDWDLFLRAAARCDVHGVELPVALVRQHTGERLSARISYDRWAAMQRESRLMLRRARALNARNGPPRWMRRFIGFRLRGQSAYNALLQAEAARDEGERAESIRFLLGMFRRSPLHASALCVRMPRTVAAVIVGRSTRG